MNLTLQLKESDRPKIIPAAQYGHFAEHLGRCIYDGIWADESTDAPTVEGYRKHVLKALQALQIPVLRWPGGCFADCYHWRDGIGDPAKRPKTINTVWGWAPESNRFGTHEFFRLCELLGCAPYLAGNMGSGTIRELAKWVEYVTSDKDTAITEERRQNGRHEPWKLPYLGIGNEAWGGGGQMRVEYYAHQYRQWQGFAKSYDFSTPMWKIACGPNANDYAWTEHMMQAVDPWMMQGLALHYYTVPSGRWEKKGDSLMFTDAEYLQTLQKAYFMEELLTKHSEIMDRYDPERQVALIVDEWGSWYDVMEGTKDAFLYQQNTMRDAMLAALTLHIFHRHTERVKMANLAQTVNVLQALILTEGNRMLCTPTYHVFAMMQGHQDAALLELDGEMPMQDGLPAVSVIASQKDGSTLISLCNPHLQEQMLSLQLPESLRNIRCSGKILTGDCRAHNTFEQPDQVVPQPYAVPQPQDGVLTLTLPACSLVTLQG